MYDFERLSEEDIIYYMTKEMFDFYELPKELQTEAICLEAVKLYGYDLKFIKNPSEKVKLEAVKQNGLAIQYVKNPTIELCLTAIKRNPFSLEFIKNPTEEMKLMAVKSNGLTLKLIEEQTIELCIEAIKQISLAIRYVNNDLLEQSPNFKYFKCKNRNLICEKINDEWLFTIGCQKQITKKEFIDRIYNTSGGLEFNPHRKEYLKILEQF